MPWRSRFLLSTLTRRSSSGGVWVAGSTPVTSPMILGREDMVCTKNSLLSPRVPTHQRHVDSAFPTKLPGVIPAAAFDAGNPLQWVSSLGRPWTPFGRMKSRAADAASSIVLARHLVLVALVLNLIDMRLWILLKSEKIGRRNLNGIRVGLCVLRTGFLWRLDSLYAEHD